MMIREKRRAAAAKGRKTRRANQIRAAEHAKFKANKARQINKAAAVANDEPGDPNTRAVAGAMVDKLRDARPPGTPPLLPATLEEWDAMRRRPRRAGTP